MSVKPIFVLDTDSITDTTADHEKYATNYVMQDY
jgi:hypothetical protein